MPTGYTSKILEQGATFEEFAMDCARAFLPETRDSDAPIAEFVEDSNGQYYARTLEAAQKRLKNVQKMSLKRAFNAAAKEFKHLQEYHQKALQETAEGCFKLATVMAQVAAYQPPSEDHVGFKNFMIEQLGATIRYDGDPEYHTKALKELRQLTPQEYKAREIKKAKREIERSTEDLAQARERNAQRNRWVSQLVNSL